MLTKVYKIELMVIDTEGTSEADIRVMLENTKYVYPSVMSIDSREIDYTDEHLLNNCYASKAEFHRLFS